MCPNHAPCRFLVMNKKDRIYLLMWLYKQEQEDEEEKAEEEA